MTYIPPYRGTVPRFGNFAGPNYTGGRGLAGQERPAPADWRVRPINYLDAVTRDHDINYTYISVAFAHQSDVDKNRAYFEADKEMFLNVMRHEPAPGDFITAAYRNALIEAFYYKAANGLFGYGLDADIKAFWETQIKAIAPNVGTPDAGVGALSFLRGKYVESGMQDLTTSGLSMQMQLMFNQHITDGTKLLNQPRAGIDGAPPDIADFKNTLVAPLKATFLDAAGSPYAVYSWSGTIDGKAVTMQFDARTGIFSRDTYDGASLIERINGSKLSANAVPNAYGQVDMQLVTTKFDKTTGQTISSETRVQAADAEFPLVRSEHFNTINSPRNGIFPGRRRRRGRPAMVSRNELQSATASGDLPEDVRDDIRGTPGAVAGDERSDMSIERPRTKALLTLATAVALSGCATGPAFQSPVPAPAGQAQVYIYRPLVLAGGGTSHRITVDARSEALSLPNASWQRVVLAPGVHALAIQDYFGIMKCGPYPLRLELAAGQTAYVANVVKTTFRLERLYIGCTVEVRPQEQALKDMAGLSGAQ